MNASRMLAILAGMSILGAGTVQAAPEKMHGKTSCVECHSLSKAEADGLLKGFRVQAESIKPNPAGMFEVYGEAAGGKKAIFFIPFSKRYVMAGQVVDAKAMKPVLMHADKLPKSMPAKAIDKIDTSKIPMQGVFTIGNKTAKKHLYVCTDPDCPYCRQLHPILNKLTSIDSDVAVHIALMPIPQLHPRAYDKARSIILSKNKQVLDDAFAGKQVPSVEGEKGKAEIDAVMKFAREVGVNGTPFVFLGDGSVYSGPRSAEEIKKALK